MTTSNTTLRRQSDRNKWLTPANRYAHHHPIMNEIVFPAAIL